MPTLTEAEQKYLDTYMTIFNLVRERHSLSSLRVAIYYKAQEDWRESMRRNQGYTFSQIHDELYDKLAAVNRRAQLALKPNTLCADAYYILTDPRNTPKGLITEAAFG